MIAISANQRKAL